MIRVQFLLILKQKNISNNNMFIYSEVLVLYYLLFSLSPHSWKISNSTPIVTPYPCGYCFK